MPLAETDLEAQERLTALRRGLDELGWTESRNLRIDYRWSAAAGDQLRTSAVELVGLKPDVLVTSATAQAVTLQRVTRNIPVVMAQGIDPVGAGLAMSLARPGSNVTGFSQYESALGGKWLELLKRIAPHVMRVAVVFDPENPTSNKFLPLIAAAAPSFSIQLGQAAVRATAEIETAISSFARESDGGLIVLPGPLAATNRDFIIGLAARHKLPAIYGVRHYAVSGGLISYGIDNADLWHRTASYVDRICNGEKPANLPIQLATKFDLVINAKAAKALGLAIPQDLRATADEVIE
jgi:putative ABC transport system substrate-binding protein